jgi:cold shock CspA family protein
MQRGIVATWNLAKQFGFIRREHGGKDIFYHISDLGHGSPIPAAGDAVSFDVGTGRTGKPCALNVHKENRAVAAAEDHFRHADATKDDGPVRFGSNPLAAG